MYVVYHVYFMDLREGSATSQSCKLHPPFNPQCITYSILLVLCSMDCSVCYLSLCKDY